MNMTTVVSTACPTTVEPTVRVQRYLPLVSSFIFARVKEFANSPLQYASRLARTIRAIGANTVANAVWLVYSGAGGIFTAMKLIAIRMKEAKKPCQIARRDAAYPYTSVKMSAKM